MRFLKFYDLSNQFNFTHGFWGGFTIQPQIVSKACGNGFIVYQESDHSVLPYTQNFYYFDYSGNNIWSKSIFSSINAYSLNIVGSDNVILVGRCTYNLSGMQGIVSVTFEGYDCSDLATSVNEKNGNQQLKISPNPTTSITTISTSQNLTNATLTIYDITGRALLQQPFNAQTTINITQLTNGIYIAEIKDKQNRSAVGKLVKD